MAPELGWNDPAAQLSHVVETEAPAVLEYRPELQLVHVVEPEAA